MSPTLQKWGLIVLKGLLTLAFGAAGLAKLAGAELMGEARDLEVGRQG